MEWTAEELIETLGMQPHQEGGWYSALGGFGVEIPKGALPEVFNGKRHSASAIYYLLRQGEESRWHKLKSDERWLWHCGGLTETTLGGLEGAPLPEAKLLLGEDKAAGGAFGLLVPAGQWQTTKLVSGSFALVSCIVSPAFSYEDFWMPDETS